MSLPTPTILSLAIVAFAAGCASAPVDPASAGSATGTDRAPAAAAARAPLFEGIGDYSMPVSTDDDLAKRYFDQGLALCHGFNHDEAARSFAEAARIDPDFAMAYWGQAYAYSPNFNLWDEGEDY